MANPFGICSISGSMTHSHCLHGTMLMTYSAPLYDCEDHVVFFLGGQINCSTTIHGMSDILRILVTPQDVNEEDVKVPDVKETRASMFGRGGFFKSFRTASSDRVPARNSARPGWRMDYSARSRD